MDEDDQSVTEPEEDFMWVLVANVVRQRLAGIPEEQVRNPQKVLRYGTKHFSSGAKVYCSTRSYRHYYGSEHASIYVLGHHRKSKRWIPIIIRTSYLEHFRIKKEFNPRMLERFRDRERLYHGDYALESGELRSLEDLAEFVLRCKEIEDDTRRRFVAESIIRGIDIGEIPVLEDKDSASESE